LAEALHRSSAAVSNGRPSTAKLSMRPARFASAWHSTAGRLSSLLPWHVPEAQAQTMSRVTSRSAVGAAGLAE
jgi:hypothetical protein